MRVMDEFQRIIGIDYGTRRLGVAISDPLKISAQSLPTIKVQGLKQVLAELDQIISSKNVTEIVVGLPLNLKGEKSSAAQKVEKFVEQLKSQFKIPVHTWDERENYTIKAKVRDINGAESDWTEKEVSMPHYKTGFRLISILQKIFNQFPNAFPLLRQLLK